MSHSLSISRKTIFIRLIGCILISFLFSQMAMAVNPPNNVKVIISPQDASLKVGETQQFTAEIQDKDGNVVAGNITWSISGQNIGTVDQNGLFTANAKGQVHVVASHQNKSDRAKVTIADDGDGGGNGNGGKKDYKVFVEPNSANLAIGDSLQFQAYLADSSGTRVDSVFAWRIKDGAVGQIDSTGMFVAVADGNTFIYASVGNLEGKAHVHVKKDNPGGNGGNNGLKVFIEPNNANLAIGDSLQFQAYLKDSSGTRIDSVFTWRVGDPSVGQIDSSGKFVAIADGNMFVYAAVGNLEGKAHVHVKKDNPGGNQWNQIQVNPPEPILKVGDQLQFTATLQDSQGVSMDSTFVWSLSDSSCGTLSSDGLFTAIDKGNAFVYAKLGDLTGRAKVVVQDSTHWDNRKDGELTIVPSDTVVTLGAEIQYRAVFVFSTGEQADTTVEWKALGRHVGDITDEGVFTATELGTGLIRAKFKRYLAMTRVTVAAAHDTAASDSVFMVFTSDSTGQVSDTTGTEGQTVFTFNGLPWPLDALNGGQVTFPPGSLDEDITIRVTMPNFTVNPPDSTGNMEDVILNGISFNVYVGDSLASPYYFDPPAHLALPYDSTLLQALNMSPEDLWMFFYTEENGLDPAGIYNVVIDDVNHMIYAEVSHFSTLAIANKNTQSPTPVGERTQTSLPSQYRLYENVPNPFNPQTVIRFDLTGQGMQHVQLVVYNILGQEVRTLVNKTLQPGRYDFRWDARDNRGVPQVSGIYIYRLTGKGFSETRRMMLIR